MKFDVLFKDKDDIRIQEMILENIHTYNEPIFNSHTTESSIRRNLMFVFRSPYEPNYSKNIKIKIEEEITEEKMLKLWSSLHAVAENDRVMPLLNEDILKKCIEKK